MISYSLRFFPAFAAACALALGAHAQDALSNGDVREIALSTPPGTRVEYFRLDLPREGTRMTPPVGVARWITGQSGTSWRSELEFIFFEENTRVVHTERVTRDSRELVFRELRARSGRTVRFIWTADQKGVCTDTSGGDVRRSEFYVDAKSALPLTLVDVVRRGGKWTGDVNVFEPLSASFATITPVLTAVKSIVGGATESVSTAPVTPSASERVLDLWRADGLRAGSFRFKGKELVSFAWQAGGLQATVISSEDYGRQNERAQRSRVEAASFAAIAPGYVPKFAH